MSLPMPDPTADELTEAERGELEFLRRRVRELDEELTEQARRANAAVAAAQERAYWLDRWHVDLNALVERPSVARTRSVARRVRGPLRVVRLLTRRLLG